jgi:hypothetical protein
MNMSNTAGVFTLFVPCCDVRCGSHIKRCSVRLYLQLYVGGPMSYLRYLCFLFCLSCVPNVTSFFLDCRFVLPFQCALTFIGQRILVI